MDWTRLRRQIVDLRGFAMVCLVAACIGTLVGLAIAAHLNAPVQLTITH